MNTNMKTCESNLIMISVSTQCGSSLTIDDENVFVMVKSYSPVPCEDAIPDEEDAVAEDDKVRISFKYDIVKKQFYVFPEKIVHFERHSVLKKYLILS